MYSDRKSSGSILKHVILCFVLVAVIVAAVGSLRPEQEISENSCAAIRAAIERSALQCYAVEGIYPPDLKYLEENYGLQINRKEYYVTYEVYASNQPPTVHVSGKKS